MIGVEELEKQHLQTYKNAVLELVRNNTDTLIQEDITSLLKQPPLDSMDLIRNKLVVLSKQNGIILDTEVVNELLLSYRNQLVNCFADILEDRLFLLSKIVEDFSPVKETDIIKLPKKEFAVINRKIKKEAKQKLKNSNQLILSELSQVFVENTEEMAKEKVVDAMSKYLTTIYSKDLIESIELKLIIKDTTLINSVLEQGERYLFTKSNSHLFDQSSV